MGAWGFRPLQNDAGLNELEMLFDKGGLIQHVRTSLGQDLHECPDEIRATAFLVYVLAKKQIWPQSTLREITSLASSRLTQMLSEEVYDNANFVAELRRLIRQLREVEPAPGRDSDRPRHEP